MNCIFLKQTLYTGINKMDERVHNLYCFIILENFIFDINVKYTHYLNWWIWDNIQKEREFAAFLFSADRYRTTFPIQILPIIYSILKYNLFMYIAYIYLQVQPLLLMGYRWGIYISILHQPNDRNVSTIRHGCHSMTNKFPPSLFLLNW